MSYMVKPKKSLGQHFLTDLSIAEAIADTLASYKGMPVLEVGPGMGVLTRFLLDKGHDLTVVELDPESVEYLQEHFPELRDRIVAKDYYKDRIPCCSGMIQKEVAERMAAPPGSKTYGILSVLLQAWYDIEYLFTVPEHVFNPPPKVKSAVIRMTRNQVEQLGCNERLFKQIVKTAFNQRRKTMRNSLRSLVGKECEVLSDPIFDERPERLSVERFIALTNLLESYIIP